MESRNLFSMLERLCPAFSVSDHILYFFLLSSFVFPQSGALYGQCAADESEIEIVIVPDNWPYEISWQLSFDGGILATGTSEGAVVCFDATITEPCLEFSIYDSYGDGIFDPGGYWIYLDGVEVATGNNYGYGETVFFDCAPGATCNDAIPLTESDYGVIEQAESEVWYVFTPPSNGMYLFSSCGAACDTRLWIYDYCDMDSFDATNEGTIYYDDQEGGCGEEATLNVLLAGGIPVWVRFGLGSSSENDVCTDGFDWEFNYSGPPTGCMDEEACNFSPLAEVDSGDCVYPSDPECTGPDLIVSAAAIVNSLSTQVMQVSETDCYIEEGCLNGYGDRELVRFTTHILNIGTLDYYIGTPSQAGNNQFEWGDCHSHWHHQGYAKYDLYTLGGEVLPIGFKNGFCVMDLECSGGGTGQYGCGNMGISAGCGDIYGSGLSCQWIDVTDVSDGTYYLVVRANYDFLPDALGRAENSYENNHAAVCISLSRSSGSLQVEIIEGCEPIYDCTGVSFGTAEMDCNGDCNGTALMGDLDANGEQDFADAVAYVEQILGNDIEALPCTDIDSDGEITVTDAAHLAQCQHFNLMHQHPDSSGFHDKCDFPVNHIVNPFDTVHFSIGAVNWEEHYLDVHVMNPNNRIIGYQFSVTGMSIATVQNLVDFPEYQIVPSFTPGGTEVIGLSFEDESLPKNYSPVPLVRLFWTSASNEVCIDVVTDVVNEDYHNTMSVIDNGCTVMNYTCSAIGGSGWVELPSGIFPDSQSLMLGADTTFEVVFNMGSSVMDSTAGVTYDILTYEVDDWLGLPMGLVYGSTAESMSAETQHCVEITGAPLESGIFTPSVSGEMFISLFGQPFSIGMQEFSFELIVEEGENPITGCTYLTASNFNPLATLDDGACEFPGCLDPEALNFSPHFNVDGGGCIYNSGNPDCPSDITGDGVVTVGDLLQLLSNFGEGCG